MVHLEIRFRSRGQLHPRSTPKLVGLAPGCHRLRHLRIAGIAREVPRFHDVLAPRMASPPNASNTCISGSLNFALDMLNERIIAKALIEPRDGKRRPTHSPKSRSAARPPHTCDRCHRQNPNNRPSSTLRPWCALLHPAPQLSPPMPTHRPPRLPQK